MMATCAFIMSVAVMLGFSVVSSATKYFDSDNPRYISDLRGLDYNEFHNLVIDRSFGAAFDYDCDGCRGNVAAMLAEGKEYSEIYVDSDLKLFDKGACIHKNFAYLRENLPKWRCDEFILYVFPVLHGLPKCDGEDCI